MLKQIGILAILLCESALAQKLPPHLSPNDRKIQDARCSITAKNSAPLRSKAISLLPPLETKVDSIVARWMPVRSVYQSGSCLYLFRICTSAFGSPLNCETGEAGAVAFSADLSTVSKFEDRFAVPPRIRAGVGSVESECSAEFPCGPRNPADQMYYAEFSGKSARDLTISKLFQLPYWGLHAKISADADGNPEGRLSFDPVIGRTWKLVDATFSLVRGQSAEGLDVYSGQLDFDFKAFYFGSGGSVAPWGAVLRRVQDENGRWQDIEMLP